MSLDPLDDDGPTLIPRPLRAYAADCDVSLAWDGHVWLATDTQTGERASGTSIPRAWASLRDCDPETVYGRLLAVGLNPYVTDSDSDSS